MHFHLFASPAYIKRFGSPKTIEELDQHRIITFGVAAPNYLRDMNWLESVGRPYDNPRLPALRVNNLVAIKHSVQRGVGIALLPDYLVEEDSGLQQLIPEVDLLSYDTYFVYPDELRNSARVHAFRDFLVSKAQRWSY